MKHTFEKEKVYDGYIIRQKGKMIWVSDYRKGGYKFVVDHSHAKHYSEQKADEHIKELEAKA